MSQRFFSYQAATACPHPRSKLMPRRRLAHAMRASLAASATMTTLRWARDRRARSHSPKGVACLERLGITKQSRLAAGQVQKILDEIRSATGRAVLACRRFIVAIAGQRPGSGR